MLGERTGTVRPPSDNPAVAVIHGEVAMTQNDQTPRTDRPPGGVDLPLPGIKTARDVQDAREHLVDPDVDFESHELHAEGRRCARCGRAIGPKEDVRRTAAGAYQHEFCPAPAPTG
jgi:hypothetical protein